MKTQRSATITTNRNLTPRRKGAKARHSAHLPPLCGLASLREKNRFRLHAFSAVCMVALALLSSGCATTEKHPPVSLAIYLQTSPELPEQVARPVQIEKPRMLLHIKSFSELTEADLDHAELDETSGGPFIRLVFGLHGTISLRALTTEFRNRYLVVFLNNKPVMAYYITQTINDGRLTVIADIPEAEVRRIVNELQPAKLEKRTR
jgi:hypothetical protein